MALLPGHVTQFKTLQRAAENGDLALMECIDKATGLPVAVVCAVNRVDGEFEFVPVAKMFDGNPYDELLPATPGVTAS